MALFSGRLSQGGRREWENWEEEEAFSIEEEAPQSRRRIPGLNQSIYYRGEAHYLEVEKRCKVR